MCESVGEVGRRVSCSIISCLVESERLDVMF